METDVLIPLKRLDAAKTRLAPALTETERGRLMAGMLARVVRAAVGAGAGRVALASSDPSAPELARRLGVDCVSDGGLPWNEGLVHARSLLDRPAGAVLYLAGDLPLVDAADVAALVDAGAEATAVIGRAHDGGTNALWVCPAGAFVPAFGAARSASVHARSRARARARTSSCSTGRASRATSTPRPTSPPSAASRRRPASPEQVFGGVADQVAAAALAAPRRSRGSARPAPVRACRARGRRPTASSSATATAVVRSS